MKKRITVILVLLFLSAIPSLAVLTEKDIYRTLSVLRYELEQERNKVRNPEAAGQIMASREGQHERMITMIKECNELALMLYSQNQDYTFDMTYALKEVSRQYEDFNHDRMPYDEILTRFDIEIDRYSRLIESLRRLPPVLSEVPELPDSLAYRNDSLEIIEAKIMAGSGREIFEGMFSDIPSDSESFKNGYFIAEEDKVNNPFELNESGCVDRDSCIVYATDILMFYSKVKEKIREDNEHYDDVSTKLKESYDYAQDRYKLVQKKIFVLGQDNYFYILSNFRMYVNKVWTDCVRKYSHSDDSTSNIINSEWRGPVVLCFMFFVLFFLALVTFCARFLVHYLRKKINFLKPAEMDPAMPCITILISVSLFGVVIFLLSVLLKYHFITVAANLLLPLVWLVSMILLSFLIRLEPSSVNDGVKLFLPIVFLGTVIITFRLIFIPNSALSLILPPVLLGFLIWQFRQISKYISGVKTAEKVISVASIFIVLAAMVLSLLGYVFVAVLVITWWLFQIAFVMSIIATYELVSMLKNRYCLKHIPLDRNGNYDKQKVEAGDHIVLTWPFDFITYVVVPVSGIISLEISVWAALNVFDLSGMLDSVLDRTFFNVVDSKGNAIFDVSASMLIVVFSLFFLFRYLSYLFKALFKSLRYENIAKKTGNRVVMEESLNLTLSNNIIGIAVWGIYIITVLLMLKIPMGAVSVIAAGLATGLGLAMKDILNNFIYAIQLMSGRLRVGDYIECDGIRGKVVNISYQSTQIETLEGAVISFLNADLFGKNFKNLTINNSYEFLKIVVGVAYGSDVDAVRSMLVESLGKIVTKDVYGRYIIDRKKGITVVFDSFGDNSINLAVKQYVLVADRASYLARAQEVIYRVLQENNIEIPFPKRDVYLKSLPSKDE